MSKHVYLCTNLHAYMYQLFIKQSGYFHLVYYYYTFRLKYLKYGIYWLLLVIIFVDRVLHPVEPGPYQGRQVLYSG